jgi:hypothetical protein
MRGRHDDLHANLDAHRPLDDSLQHLLSRINPLNRMIIDRLIAFKKED